jgi:hypothetical protein
LERPKVPDPESRPQRRKFATAYKLAILREIDAVRDPGGVTGRTRMPVRR